ncbi:hypothetical protein BDP55DRAFT_637834 [Colletotrichum godetiae]|uniref:Uncharacterized protein n=1 Tax=Colletotrichum godetiae TaxID=1209918 RepID=A0AAJ0A8H4_9PEZI|nr:uncharacterized protein BDP55DRAFT_637834 [Colletotrichum godetiae]KAK1658476.1 hypothetical protein BDP55DRAFT_637834 [Colletotrichum godetiae]
MDDVSTSGKWPQDHVDSKGVIGSREMKAAFLFGCLSALPIASSTFSPLASSPRSKGKGGVRAVSGHSKRVWEYESIDFGVRLANREHCSELIVIGFRNPIGALRFCRLIRPAPAFTLPDFSSFSCHGQNLQIFLSSTRYRYIVGRLFSCKNSIQDTQLDKLPPGIAEASSVSCHTTPYGYRLQQSHLDRSIKKTPVPTPIIPLLFVHAVNGLDEDQCIWAPQLTTACIDHRIERQDQLASTETLV